MILCYWIPSDIIYCIFIFCYNFHSSYIDWQHIDCKCCPESLREIKFCLLHQRPEISYFWNCREWKSVQCCTALWCWKDQRRAEDHYWWSGPSKSQHRSRKLWLCPHQPGFNMSYFAGKPVCENIVCLLVFLLSYPMKHTNFLIHNNVL